MKKMSKGTICPTSCSITWEKRDNKHNYSQKIAAVIAVMLAITWLFGRFDFSKGFLGNKISSSIYCLAAEINYDEKDLFKEIHKALNTPLPEPPAAEEQEPSQPAYPTDPRGLIRAVCAEEGVDPALALAISRLETGNWTSNACLNYHNFGGLSVAENPIYFNDDIEGVQAFIRNLKYNYIDIGLTTISQISGKWCPASQDSWASQVESLFMEEQ